MKHFRVGDFVRAELAQALSRAARHHFAELLAFQSGRSPTSTSWREQ